MGGERRRIKMNLSQLKLMRVINNLTQEQLAQLLGISQAYCSLLERNKRELTPELNKKIEEVFKLSFKFID